MTFLLKIKRSRIFLTLCLAVSAILCSTPNAQAQDEEKKNSKEYPLITVNVSNFDRITKDVDYIFRAADRSDIMGMINKQIGAINNFKGIDRSKSFGLIVFLELAIPPSVSPIGYIPITSKDDFIKTIKTAGATVEAVKDLEETYDVKRGNEPGGVTLYFTNGYCFIGKDAETLDREFPNPESWAKGLAAKYDVAASLNLNSIPDAAKKLFVIFLQQYSNAQSQQRDNEPDGAYQFRKNQSASQMEFVEGLLKYGESFTIGLDASEEKKSATIELEILAKNNSPFAKELSEFTGKKSYFSNLVNDEAPLSASMSVKLTKTNQKQYTSAIVFAKEQILKQMTRQNLGDGETPSDSDIKMLDRVGNPLIHTIEKGFMDLFLQFNGNPKERMTIIGGAKIEEGKTLALGLPQLLTKIQEMEQNGPVIELNHFTHRNVTFHKLSERQREGQPQREGMFGKSPAFYIGVGANTVWITFGSEQALTEMKTAMDKVADRTRIGQKSDTRAPIHAVANISRWLEIAPKRTITRKDGQVQFRPNQGRERAEKAFTPGEDKINLEVRPLENGMRMRVKFEEGMVKFVGAALAEGLEVVLDPLKRAERQQKAQDAQKQAIDRAKKIKDIKNN